jgi:hypothetical protein
VQGRIERWRSQLPNAEVVAPLIAPGRLVSPGTRHDVLVNFGGLSSLLVPEAAQVAYARSMVECVVEALADWEGEITITAGQHVLNPIDDRSLRLARDDVRFVSLSQADYLKELERSRCVISSPGLHATQEACLRGIPCLLLPSQNFSQALLLHMLHRAGAAFAMDWDAIYDVTGLSAENEAIACWRIADGIRRFERDDVARARLVGHRRARLAPDYLERIAAAQAAFFEPYRSEDGPETVAAYLRHLVSPGSLGSSPPVLAGPAAPGASIDQAQRAALG